MSQNDFNLEVIERLSSVEAKLDALLAGRQCEKNSGRITALEQKFWIASGMIAVIGTITGYIMSKLPILQILAGGVP